MKTKDTSQLLMILALIFSFIACEEDGDVSVTETALVLDGTKYVMDDISIEAMEEHGEMMLFVDASNDDNASFNIGLYNYTGKGSYTLEEGSDNMQGHMHISTTDASFYFESISVEIVNDTEGSIAGTFIGTVHSSDGSATGVAASGTFTQEAGDGDDTEESFIPASYLDTMQWTETYLVYFDDATMGFDFSANDYVDGARDGYLDRSTLAFVNSFLFDGENHIKKFTAINLTEPMTIPDSWDTTNETLSVGSYYVVECADGYALFKVNSYMECCGEFMIKFSFVPTTAIE